MSFLKKNLENIDNKRSNLFLNPYTNKNETIKEKKLYDEIFEPLTEFKIKEPLTQKELDMINQVNNRIFEPIIGFEFYDKNFKTNDCVNINKELDEKIKKQIEELNKIKYAYKIKNFLNKNV